DTSTNSPTSWYWTFGDGTTASTQNPAHTYSGSGPYTVTLKASSSGGSSTASATVSLSSSASNLPDLVYTGVGYYPTRVFGGQKVSIFDTTQNIGGVSASGFFNYYYLSKDSVYSSDDIKIGEKYITSLAPGASVSPIASLSIPKYTIPAGGYYLIIRVDSTNAIQESDENNAWFLPDKIMVVM
ncbi:MAG: PKD domain-containing protein, partial [Methanoregulaceae archaeon]|nr:PKD domain-containing protein [Methanoregulaceae archaeon]